MVYSLSDPESGEIRYIGVTFSIKNRLRGHVDSTKKGSKLHVHNWIRKIAANDIAPEIQVIEIVPPGGLWEEKERFWIKHYRSIGADLTNMTDGGEGTFGAVASKETRMRISEGKKRYFDEVGGMPVEVREKISNTIKGRKFPEEQKRNMSIGAKNRPPRSKEHCNNISEAKKGVSHGPCKEETKRRISAANLGRKRPAETNAKNSASHKGKKTPEDVKLKISQALLGRKKSDETKLHMSQAQQSRFG